MTVAGEEASGPRERRAARNGATSARRSAASTTEPVRAGAVRPRRLRVLACTVTVLVVGLLHCGTGAPTGEEERALAANRRIFVGPDAVTFPYAPRVGSSNASGAEASRSAQVADDALQVPLAEREADCSLTEVFVDQTQEVVVRREPGLHLKLHALAGLTTAAGAFPSGCTDRVLGIASSSTVVAGRRAGGEYFGATTTFDADATLRIVETDGRTSLRPLKQIEVRPPGSAYEIESLVTADVTGDGRKDLVVALADFSVANGTGQVAVLRSKGKGKFAAPVFLALAFPARGVTVANLDADQLPDIVAVGVAASGSTLASFKNLGGGNFAAAVLAPQGAQGSRVVAADLDGDLKQDVATSLGQWLRGKGDGTFEAPVATGWTGRTLATADFDHDGVADVAVGGAGFGTQVAIYRGLGGGMFTPLETYAGTLDLENVAVAEIDGDGNLDLVLGLASGGLYAPSDASGGVTSYLLGRGDGTFAGVPVRDGVVAAVADFDGDELPDLLTAKDAGTTRFRLYRNKKKFKFKAPVVFDESFAIVDLVAGEIDANETPDYVALARGPSVSDPATLHVRLRQGGSFVVGDDETLGFAPTQGAARSLALGDFNRDGALDVAVIGSLTTPGLERPGVLVVLLGAGNGTFAPPSTIATDLLNPIALVATDLDGAGGIEDLVLIEAGDPFAPTPKPGATRVYAGKGDGTFVTPPIVLDGVVSPTALAVADVNDDGMRDVLVAGPDSSEVNTLQVALRRASGRFADPKVLPLVQFATTGIAVADLDRDGSADAVLTGCCGVSFTSVLSGKGNGKFGPEAFLPMEVSGARPELVDLDRDARPDLVLSLQSRAGIALLRNLRRDP